MQSHLVSARFNRVWSRSLISTPQILLLADERELGMTLCSPIEEMHGFPFAERTTRYELIMTARGIGWMPELSCTRINPSCTSVRGLP